MAEIGERLIADAPGAGFAERHVDPKAFASATWKRRKARNWCTCMAPALGSAAPTTC